MLDVKKKLLWLLHRDEKVVIKKNEDVTPKKIENTEEPISLEVEKFIYYRFEKVRIDWNFKYKHCSLTGDTKKDFDNLFGIHDSHGSARVLEHSFRENYLKIKRSYDICLSLNDGVYTIYNGRHRIIYLKAFLERYGCNNFDSYFEIPASVNYCIDDVEVNTIINSLKKEYKAIVQKGNYYDDELSFFIVLEGKIYIVKDKDELKKFYSDFKTGCDKFLLSEVADKQDFSTKEIFQSIFKAIGKALFEMSFIDLFCYINENGVVLNNRLLKLKNLDISAIYTYHFHICESIQICKVYNYDIPNDLDVIKVRNNPVNFYGCIIMDFIYDNPVYRDLSWNELFEIVKKFRGFENCDSDFLRGLAIKFGYIEGKGQVQKRKKWRNSLG